MLEGAGMILACAMTARATRAGSYYGSLKPQPHCQGRGERDDVLQLSKMP